MKLVILVFSLVALCAMVLGAAADPAAGYPPSRQAVKAALGSSWEVAPAGGLEAYRRPQSRRAPDFEARRQSAARWLRERSGAMTVDFGRGSAHLAGQASDCDRVIAAAQRFAEIPGIDDLIIDTSCRPRD